MYLVAWGCAGEENHEVGMLDTRDVDFLAIDDIVVAIAHGGGANLGGIAAGFWLGDSEGLEAQLSLCDLRQVTLLLFFGAMT